MIHSYQAPFWLVRYDGVHIGPYETLELIVSNFKGRLREYVGMQPYGEHPISAADRLERKGEFEAYAVEANDGSIVHTDTLEAVYKAVFPRRRRLGWPDFLMEPNWHFRSGPVPRTGKRGGKNRWLRSPQTTNERRAAAAAVADKLEGLIRGRRRCSQISHAWCDIPRRDETGWKRHRRTQYRVRMA